MLTGARSASGHGLVTPRCRVRIVLYVGVVTEPHCTNLETGHQDADLDVSHHSTSIEQMIELTLIAELVQEAWFGHRERIDVLHSSVDAFGYDIVLECRGVMRHIQLKARNNTTTKEWPINTSLAVRPSGCIVLITWNRIEGTNRIGMRYHWFGGGPGERLPSLGDKVAKNSRANAEGIKQERKNIRRLRINQFVPLEGAAGLLHRLFGIG